MAGKNAKQDVHSSFEKASQADDKANDNGAAEEIPSVTKHHVKIGGQDIAYKATVGSMLIKSGDGKPAALIYYTAYNRTDVPDAGKRPVSFLYNGGPGSSSAWLHMGAFGPRRVETTDAGPTAPAPYNTVDNANSLLDKTDMVFIDPVGTGFSHVVGKGKNKDFWGIDQDIKSLTQFVSRYVTQNDRWNSPKFLIGESYGTLRSAALANSLQSNENMDLNGIVLMSSVLNYNTLIFPRGEDLAYQLYLPSYAATAWYHGLIKDPPADVQTFITQAKEFSKGEYAKALWEGAELGDAERAAVVKKLAHFTGLSEDYLLKADLRVNNDQFEAELQRSRGLITGRLDSRFSGQADDKLAETASRDPQSEAISGAFTTAFNRYVRNELDFNNPDLKYNLLANEPIEKWDWRHGNGEPGAPNVVGDLTQAMISNPNLKVQIESGLYDLATPFFATEYTVNHLGLPAALRKNISQNEYEAGHMMYLRPDDLAKLKTNIAAFIDSASGQPSSDAKPAATSHVKKKPPKDMRHTG